MLQILNISADKINDYITKIYVDNFTINDPPSGYTDILILSKTNFILFNIIKFVVYAVDEDSVLSISRPVVTKISHIIHIDGYIVIYFASLDHEDEPSTYEVYNYNGIILVKGVIPNDELIIYMGNIAYMVNKDTMEIKKIAINNNDMSTDKYIDVPFTLDRYPDNHMLFDGTYLIDWNKLSNTVEHIYKYEYYGNIVYCCKEYYIIDLDKPYYRPSQRGKILYKKYFNDSTLTLLHNTPGAYYLYYDDDEYDYGLANYIKLKSLKLSD